MQVCRSQLRSTEAEQLNLPMPMSMSMDLEVISFVSGGISSLTALVDSSVRVLPG